MMEFLDGLSWWQILFGAWMIWVTLSITRIHRFLSGGMNDILKSYTDLADTAREAMTSVRENAIDYVQTACRSAEASLLAARDQVREWEKHLYGKPEDEDDERDA